MTAQGTVRSWNTEKGFGFIQSAHSSNVFFHVRDFRGAGAPAVGMAVVYEEIQVGGKGPRAMQVRPATATATATAPAAPRLRPPAKRQHRSAQAPAGSGLAVALMLLWLGLLAWGTATRALPLWVWGGLGLLNVLTFFAYALDKEAARKGLWRTSEKHLHLLALLGGWPAAWWAQQRLRHKSSKTEFRSVYWATLLLNCAALAVLVWQPAWARPFLLIFQ